MRIKRRLEEIKFKFNNTIDVMLYMPYEDVKFLIEQAERVQELEQQNKRYREALKNIYELAEYDEYDNTLEQIVSEIKKALEGTE